MAQALRGAAEGGPLMENTRVVLRLKPILVVVHLRCVGGGGGSCFSALIAAFLGTWGTGARPAFLACCLRSILPRGAGGEAGGGQQSREVPGLVVSAPRVHPCRLHLGLAPRAPLHPAGHALPRVPARGTRRRKC